MDQDVKKIACHLKNIVMILGGILAVYILSCIFNSEGMSDFEFKLPRYPTPHEQEANTTATGFSYGPYPQK